MHISLFKTKSRTDDYILQPIAHGVHQMIIAINRGVDLAPKSILIPCVIDDLGQEVYTAGVNDYFIALNILNPIVYAVFALSGPGDPRKASFPKLINAFRLG